MRKLIWFCTTLIIVTFLILGCSTSSTGEHEEHDSKDVTDELENDTGSEVEDGKTEDDDDKTEDVAENVPEPEPEPEPEPYSLEVNVEKIGDDFVLTFETDLILSRENYEKEHVEGEGHIHLFRNYQLVGPILEHEPVVLQYLKEGENVIRVDLARNDHTSYRVSREVRIMNE